MRPVLDVHPFDIETDRLKALLTGFTHPIHTQAAHSIRQQIHGYCEDLFPSFYVFTDSTF
jgi:hypothetical protein